MSESKQEEVFLVKPESLTRVALKDVRRGDVIKCTLPDGNWDYRIVSSTSKGVSAMWRKVWGGDSGGAGMSDEWVLERVNPKVAKVLKKYYEEGFEYKRKLIAMERDISLIKLELQLKLDPLMDVTVLLLWAQRNGYEIGFRDKEGKFCSF
ncbi:MAG: hypothetical protein AAB611_02010 [Patescibacteria group bacterium]